MTVDKVRGASQNSAIAGSCVGIEILKTAATSFAMGLITSGCAPALCQLEDLFTAIVWVRFTTQDPARLQPRDTPVIAPLVNASDRTEVAPAIRPRSRNKVEALVDRLGPAQRSAPAW